MDNRGLNSLHTSDSFVSNKSFNSKAGLALPAYRFN